MKKVFFLVFLLNCTVYTLDKPYDRFLKQERHVSNVMFENNVFFTNVTVAGVNGMKMSWRKYSCFDTNGDMLKSEFIRLKNKKPVSEKRGRAFPGYHETGPDDPVGFDTEPDVFYEFDPLGFPKTKWRLEGEGQSPVLLSRFVCRQDDKNTFMIETDVRNGHRVLTVTRDRKTAMQVIDPYKNKGALYQYFYYYQGKLAAVMAETRQSGKNTRQYHVVYEYNSFGRIEKEEWVEYVPKQKRETGIYRYDSYGNIVQFEQYADKALVGFGQGRYVYYNGDGAVQESTRLNVVGGTSLNISRQLYYSSSANRKLIEPIIGK